jgi:hypothetical protein
MVCWKWWRFDLTFRWIADGAGRRHWLRFPRAPLLVGTVFGPLLATDSFIITRLWSRLAWNIGQTWNA